jgi:hypothetical protein
MEGIRKSLDRKQIPPPPPPLHRWLIYKSLEKILKMQELRQPNYYAVDVGLIGFLDM